MEVSCFYHEQIFRQSRLFMVVSIQDSVVVFGPKSPR